MMTLKGHFEINWPLPNMNNCRHGNKVLQMISILMFIWHVKRDNEMHCSYKNGQWLSQKRGNSKLWQNRFQKNRQDDLFFVEFIEFFVYHGISSFKCFNWTLMVKLVHHFFLNPTSPFLLLHFSIWFWDPQLGSIFLTRYNLCFLQKKYLKCSFTHCLHTAKDQAWLLMVILVHTWLTVCLKTGTSPQQHL